MAHYEEKVELLRKVDIFSKFREYEFDIIAKYSEFMNYKRGESIFAQGSPAGELYIVEKGRIGIISYLNEDDVGIAQIIAGESFGEFDFLGKTLRNAGAFAEEETTVLRFPSRRYSSIEIFNKHPDISARMLFRLMSVITERIWDVNRLLREKSLWLHDLRKQLYCDKTTGLYNYVFLEEDFINILPEVGERAAFLMIKPDNFKEINDRFGHRAGDQVLNIMAIFLQSELGEYDIGVRYLGDEFAAFMVNSDKNEAIQMAKSINSTYKSMDLSGIIGFDPFKINVSIGIALYPDNADTSAGLVKIAHRKMLEARNLGGNRTIV